MKGPVRVVPIDSSEQQRRVARCRAALRHGRGSVSLLRLLSPHLLILWVFVSVCLAYAGSPEWGQDVLVGSAGESLSICKLTADSDTNGDIYVGALASDSAGLDTIYTWRSTDGGISWKLTNCLASDSLTGPIRDYEMRIGSDAEGTWIYHFLIFGTTNDSGGVWLYRQRAPASPGTWHLIVPGGDTILRLAADRNIENPEDLFVAWETQSGLINLMSSNDSGQTWGNIRTAFAGCERPAVCAGGDGCMYVAANARDSAWVAVARYSGNLTDTTPVIAKLDSSSDQHVWSPSIAADRGMPESLQAAIAMYSHRDTAGKVTPHFGWTTNGGASWGWSVWPVTNQSRATWDARYPCVRRSYDDDLIRAVVTLHEPSTNWDTLVYAYARPGSPTSWEGRATLNMKRASDQYGAKVGYSVASDGGFLVYGAYGPPFVYYDGYDFVGTTEKTATRSVRADLQASMVWGKPLLDLSLANAAYVRVAAFDACGRSAGVLFDGSLAAGSHRVELNDSRLRPGVYYLNVQMNGVRRVTKMVLAVGR